MNDTYTHKNGVTIRRLPNGTFEARHRRILNTFRSPCGYKWMREDGGYPTEGVLDDLRAAWYGWAAHGSEPITITPIEFKVTYHSLYWDIPFGVNKPTPEPEPVEEPETYTGLIKDWPVAVFERVGIGPHEGCKIIHFGDGAGVYRTEEGMFESLELLEAGGKWVPIGDFDPSLLFRGGDA